MPDYGHQLTFGSFITPTAQNAQQVVALAQLSEAVGLDYATFQDHPYNNTFLDTWTLMTWVAAATERIHIAPNVLNLPLRPPAMIARSAASLDVLSGGRFELGLGAGAFWDPIVAMGGEKRTPGESMRALREAIEILRQAWDTDRRGGVRHDGEFYTVKGMRPGPEMPHDPEIWLGVYKPVGLKLLGEKGDGWLPSLGYMTVPDLAEGNARIDDAAESAGRRAEDIRRLLNISGSFLRSDRGFLQATPETWAEQLTELALTYGISGFILGGDDPSALQAFGEEVAPAVREAVARERGEEPAEAAPFRERMGTGFARSAEIDYDAIPESLKSAAITPDAPGYDRVRSTYMQEGTPGLVLMTRNAEQVAEALAFSQSQDVPLSIRAGSHGSNGLSTNNGGIVLDVSRINDIHVVDEGSRRFRVGTGATWGMVAQELGPHGWAMTSGDFPDVGVGGIVTAGGVGLLARKYGLTIDNVVAAEIVTADGSFYRTSEHLHSELFWGIRGAGGNLGVVTHVELNALPVGEVIIGQFTYDASSLATVLTQWGAIMEQAPRELQAFAYYSPVRRGSGATLQVMAVWSNDDVEAGTAALTPLLEVGPVLQQSAHLVPYSAMMTPTNQAHTGQQTLRGHTGLIEHLNRETAEAIATLAEDAKVPWLNFRHVGGAVNDIPADATAYAHRTQQVVFSAYDLYSDLRRLNPAWEAFRPYVSGTYINLESDTSEAVVREAYPTPTYERIQQLKQEYDPNNVFSRNFNVPPR